MSDVELLLADEARTTDAQALDVLRRGMRLTPSIRRPLVYSVGLSLLAAIGRLAVPILMQQVLDRGLLGDGGYDANLVVGLSAVALGIVVTVAVLSPLAEIALVRGAQDSLHELRRMAFAHIHRLSLQQHGRARTGTLLARVTSDIESVSRFVEWGLLTWALNVSVIGGALVVMALYSWQLTLIAIVSLVLVVPTVRALHVRLLRAHDRVRTTSAGVLSVVNETLTGADAIRSYGYEDVARERLDAAIDDRYRADVGTSRYASAMFTVGDFIGTLALVTVAVAAAEWGQDWGLTVGSVVSFFFLLSLVQTPIGEIAEVLDQTQTAVAGWNKVLTLLEDEPEIAEPRHPVELPMGPLAVEVRGLVGAYGDAVVLRDVDVTIEAGSNVAIVGETGSGKTTFARLLCRLLDPASGSIELGGVDLADVAPASRRGAVRLVPQDGFLFDASVADNIAFGRPGSDRADVETAISELGLDSWVAGLSNGLDTRVGPRGELLSVGERQLVALARAQVADPGLLILDEATSSVDPETEQALAAALRRIAAGRTVVAIAHRLSTAEQADSVLVFDQGRLVERGAHSELVRLGGVYAGLHASWRRATSADVTD